MLAGAQSLDEQGDILHYLVNCYGLEHNIKVSSVISNWFPEKIPR